MGGLPCTASSKVASTVRLALARIHDAKKLIIVSWISQWGCFGCQRKFTCLDISIIRQVSFTTISRQGKGSCIRWRSPESSIRWYSASIPPSSSKVCLPESQSCLQPWMVVVFLLSILPISTSHLPQCTWRRPGQRRCISNITHTSVALWPRATE